MRAASFLTDVGLIPESSIAITHHAHIKTRRSVSRFGLVVRRQSGKQRGLGSNLLSQFLKVWSVDFVL